MTPLNLRTQAPRAPREMLLGYYFLPRTIDKLRAELPGGDPGDYLNGETGFSAFVVKRLGLSMGDLRAAVADAADEAELSAWLAARIDAAGAAALNAKLETFVVERMSPEDQGLVRQRHPVLAQRPELSKILDILEADDRYGFDRLRSPGGD